VFHVKAIRIARFPNTGRTTCSFALLLLVFFFGSSTLPAQSKNLSAEKRAQVEKAEWSFMAANSVPGISVAVIQDGELVWSQGFGMAHLENFVPASSSTLFRLGAISKPITATAVLRLAERGKLEFDAEVEKYCPAFPKKEWPITTRELLGHLGGI
jgi:CubicO group peptidase (beta-lactamase class C family)